MSNDAIAEFYRLATAVLVSPHGLRTRMDRGDSSFSLIDLRSPVEFEAAHIRGAVNIPAYLDPNTPDYGAKERFLKGFRALPESSEVIVYCYSSACMTGKKIGNLLAQNQIYVKHLGIGWNEWRYEWKKWNHEHEWDQCKVEDYITVSGEEHARQLRANPIQCEC